MCLRLWECSCWFLLLDAEKSKSFQEQFAPVANCLSAVVGSIQGISSLYRPNVNFFEFKALSSDNLDAAYESIKKLGNELANNLKINRDNHDEEAE